MNDDEKRKRKARDPDEDELENLIEISRPEITTDENTKLLAIRTALGKRLSKKAVAELLIAYAVEHSEEILTWYGKRAAEEVAKLKL